MKKLFFDIETLPAEESKHEALRYLYEKKKGKKGGALTTFEEFVGNTSFDGAYGRVFCIAVAVDDGEIQYFCNPDNEKKTIEQFWQVAAGVDLFVGHNIMSFDLRFLMQRSIVLGVKPSWQTEEMRAPKYLGFARYRNSPIFDTMQEWVNWDYSKSPSLEHVALALDIPTPKDGIDGSQVHSFYKAGKIQEICDYCKRDVDVTRRIYKRMMFQK